MNNYLIRVIASIGLNFTLIQMAAAQTAVGNFPRDVDMTAAVKKMTSMIGLRNEISVVVEPGAKGCAYATTVQGLQYIVVDPACVGPIKTRSGAYNFRALNILAHEVGHHLNGHTTNQQEDNPAEETAADEWSGWAMYRFGGTLEQAQTFMRTASLEGGKAHPARKIRMESVERGWESARDGKMPERITTLPEWWSALMKEPLPWIR